MDKTEYSQGILSNMPVALADGETMSFEDTIKLLNIYESLLNERQRVIDLIPECEAHGSNCIPHCLEWIKSKS